MRLPGGNRLSTFFNARKTLPPGLVEGGCIAEGTRGRALTAWTISASNMTRGVCADICTSLGFALSGTEYHNECYCGKSVPSAGTFFFDDIRSLSCRPFLPLVQHLDQRSHLHHCRRFKLQHSMCWRQQRDVRWSELPLARRQPCSSACTRAASRMEHWTLHDGGYLSASPLWSFDDFLVNDS